MTNYDTLIDSQWDGRKYPTFYSTELLSANCNQGTAMLAGLNNGLAGVKNELDGLQGLGVKAVVICINYPLLDQNFWNSPQVNQPQYYSQFLTYYQDIVQEIHRRQLKVIVESQSLFSSGVASNLLSALNAYYKNLTFAQFESERAAEEVVTASEIKPDYLLLQTEPDTEAFEAHRPELNDPARDVMMIATMVSALDHAGIPGLHASILVGSGFGSWQNHWQLYLSGLLQISGLDVIDTHNYFTSGGDINNELAIADQVKLAGKQVGMSEYWLEKTLAAAPSISTPAVDVNDDYSFWAPLDQKFIQLMYKIANDKQFAYTSAFWDLRMFAYLDYDQAQSQICGGQPCTVGNIPQIAAALNQATAQALKNGKLTDTGIFFKDLMAGQ